MSRFDPHIDQMRAALRARSDDDLMAALHRQLANLKVAALAADDAANYVDANSPAEELTGYTAAEIRGLRLADITPLPSTVDAEELWQDFIVQGAQRGEFELRPRTGAPIRVRYWAYASVAPGIHVSLLERVDTA